MLTSAFVSCHASRSRLHRGSRERIACPATPSRDGVANPARAVLPLPQQEREGCPR